MNRATEVLLAMFLAVGIIVLGIAGYVLLTDRNDPVEQEENCSALAPYRWETGRLVKDC